MKRCALLQTLGRRCAQIATFYCEVLFEIAAFECAVVEDAEEDWNFACVFVEDAEEDTI